MDKTLQLSWARFPDRCRVNLLMKGMISVPAPAIPRAARAVLGIWVGLVMGIALGVNGLLAPVYAQEDARSDTLPEALAEDQFGSLMGNSPFTRSLDLSSEFALTGIAHIEGKPVVTLMHRETKKTVVVSDIPNDAGWKMVGVSPGTSLDVAAAQILVAGGEVVTLHFDQRQLHPVPSPNGGGVQIPKGTDNRSKPTDDERRKFGEFVRDRMAKMSDDQKKEAGKIMGEKMKENPNLSDRQKGEVFISILDHVHGGKK